ncbi:hypothetical protein ACFX15_043285 [Malus domestica]
MASSKGQAILATTKGRILSTSAANIQSIDATTTLQHATSKLVLLNEQMEHQKCESVINLTSLGAPKHAAKAHKMTSQSSKRRFLSAFWMTKGKSPIARLTRIMEEKDLQIVALTSRLEPQDGGNPDPDDDPLKRRAGEEEEPPVDKINVKPELD